MKHLFKGKSKKRTVSWLISILMVLTIVPLVAFVTAPDAKAVDVGDWNALVNAVNSGSGDIAITLTNNLTVTSQLNIPAGKNVSINLNGRNISKAFTDSLDMYNRSGTINNTVPSADISPNVRLSMAAGIEAFPYQVSKIGTDYSANVYYIFNIDAGAALTISGSGTVQSSSNRTDASGNDWAGLYSHVRAIRNAGTFNLAGGSIFTSAKYEFNGGWAHNAAAVGIAIYNEGGIVNVSGGTVRAEARAKPRLNNNDSVGDGWSMACGIYNPPGTAGQVNISGGYHFSKAYTSAASAGSTTPSGNSRQRQLNALSVGIDLNDSASCTMTGGMLEAETTTYPKDVGSRQHFRDAQHGNFAMGIHHSGANYPTITGTGAKIAVDAWHDNGSIAYPGSTTDIAFAISTTPTAGNDASKNSSFRDEYGALIKADGSANYPIRTAGTSPNHPESANKAVQYALWNGALPENAKMLSYYRVFEGVDKSAAIGSQSLITPDAYFNARMNGAIGFTGTNGSLIYKNTAVGFDTSSLTSKNSNYYYYGGTDYEVRDNSAQAAASTAPGLANNTAASGSMPYPGAKQLALVYVNIFKKAPLAAVPNVNGVPLSKPYTGSAITPAEIGIAFLNTAGGADVSGRFNVDGGADAAKSRVTYAYTGDASGSGLPTAPGSYTISVTVPDSTAYSEAVTLDAGHNIQGGAWSFPLTILPAACEHDWAVTSSTPATCIAAGSADYECTLCNDTKTEALAIDTDAHNYGAPVVVAADCETAGSSTVTCAYCNDEDVTVIPALGHIWTAADCESPAVCSRCTTASGSALGHDFAADAARSSAATCTATGLAAETCTRCTETNDSVLAMLAHDYADATCTAPKTCKNCPATDGSPLGHSFAADAVRSSAATCTATGLAAETCTRCTETNDSVIAVLAHDFQFTSTTPATCMTDGETLETCANCTETKTTPIAATGVHSYILVPGANYSVCGDCGKPNLDGILALLPDADKEDDYTPESWKEMQDAYAELQDAIDNGADPADIDAAAIKFAESVAALKHVNPVVEQCNCLWCLFLRILCRILNLFFGPNAFTYVDHARIYYNR